MLWAGLALVGCATPQTDALRLAPPAALPQRIDLAGVPFKPQQEYQCGPAALSMVLSAAGVEIEPDALVPQVYLPARGGSLPPEMLAAARRQDRFAVTLPPRLDAVLSEVAAGRPVIALQNLSLPIAPVWHYAVVVGYDLSAGELLMHTGPEPRARVGLRVFERTWSRAGSWAMVALRPGELPVSVDTPRLVAAAAALERLSPDSARAVYAALTVRDPTSWEAWMGLGNATYATGDALAASTAFERATRLAPEAADGWNNLAHARRAAGDPVGARAAARHAVGLGGARVERYRRTLDEVSAVGAPSNWTLRGRD